MIIYSVEYNEKMKSFTSLDMANRYLNQKLIDKYYKNKKFNQNHSDQNNKRQSYIKRLKKGWFDTTSPTWDSPSYFRCHDFNIMISGRIYVNKLIK